MKRRGAVKTSHNSKWNFNIKSDKKVLRSIPIQSRILTECTNWQECALQPKDKEEGRPTTPTPKTSWLAGIPTAGKRSAQALDARQQRGRQGRANSLKTRAVRILVQGSYGYSQQQQAEIVIHVQLQRFLIENWWVCPGTQLAWRISSQLNPGAHSAALS